MGSSSSKGQYPYPRQYGNTYGRPYGPPGPQNYHFPNGQYQPGGFIPPYGVIPTQQVVWPQQEMPRRRRKTRRHKDSRRESDRDRHVPMAVPHPAAPGPAASQISHAPVVPTPNPHLAPAPAPAPAPAASPAPARGSLRRTQTPFPRSQDVAEEDDGEGSDPVLPHGRPQSRARAHTPVPTAPQDQSMHRVPSRGPREPLYQPQQPAHNLNIASALEPLPPANPAVFGPSQPRQYAPLDNPLPPPPRDLYESSPYKSLLSLPQTTALLTANFAPKPAAKETKKRKGIFRAFSSRKHESEEKKDPQVHFVPIFVNNPPPGGNPMPPMPAIPPLPQAGAPGPYPNPLAGGRPQHHPREIRYNEDSDYWSFMNHSPHRIYFDEKEWPTATHLIEARKYLPSHPAIADEIRLCGDVAHVYPISANYQQFQDPHWSENHMQILEDVLYLKFSQHADLRSTLWETEDARLIYEDRDDPYWGVGPSGDGANLHGTLLERVRARLLEGRIPQR